MKKLYLIIVASFIGILTSSAYPIWHPDLGEPFMKQDTIAWDCEHYTFVVESGEEFGTGDIGASFNEQLQAEGISWIRVLYVENPADGCYEIDFSISKNTSNIYRAVLFGSSTTGKYFTLIQRGQNERPTASVPPTKIYTIVPGCEATISLDWTDKGRTYYLKKIIEGNSAVTIATINGTGRSETFCSRLSPGEYEIPDVNNGEFSVQYDRVFTIRYQVGDEYCDIDADGGIYDLYFDRINDAGNMISITCLEDLEFLENAFNEYNSGNSINWNNHMRITYGYDEEQCLGYIRVICPPNLGRADIENYSMLHGISGDEISFFQGGAGSISADVSYKKDMQNSMLYAEITSPQIDVVYKFYKDDVELSRRTGFMSVITFSTPIAKGRYKVTAHYGSEEVELNSYTINSDSGFNFPNNKNWIYSRTANGANSSHDIVYFDGLGFETQLVNINASGDGMSDVITPIVYDEMYRMTHKYLPYPVKNNEGNFISSAISKQNTYYAEKYPTQSNATSAYAFRYDQYEKSPLNRIEKSFKPGKTYQENALHAETIVYKTNQGSEITGARQIQLMSVDPITGVLTIHNENYDAKTLICKTLTNEDGEIMNIYSDNEGRIILTEQKSTSGSGALATVEYFITRYIYDDFGRLTWVITPEGESYFTEAKTYNKDGANARKYCYIYLYDNHGRLIEKHYPGRYKPEYFVYDRANRLMMRQDGNMMVGAYTETAKQRWMLYKYDALGRLIGEYIVMDEATTATTRFILQSTFDNGEIPLLYNDSAATLLHQYVHDEPAANISWNFVDVSGLTKDGTVSLKDDRTKGLLTYEKLAILESGTVTGYHERTFYYDYKGRVIQTIEKDPQHRFLRSSNKYDYIGNPIRVQEVYIDGSRMDVLERTFEYDSRNRLIKETARINNGTQSIVTFSYDALGNLVGKKYGEGTNAISEQLEYNLQGWVTTKSNDLFEMNLRYYDPIHKTTKYYSGNITEWEWKHKKLETGQSTGTTNCYAFTYDQLSRLTSSEQYIDGVKNKQNVEKMLSYDKNGNLKTLLRYRHGAQSANLSFKYDGNRISSFERNKLIDWDGMIIGPPVIGGGIITPLSSSNVIDFDPVEMDPDLTRDPYKYDKNGNMKVDGLRETSMSYNVLNLLEKVSKGDTIVTKYSYLADGTKLKAVDGDSRGFEYRGSLIYSQDGNTLSFESVSFGDGRIVKTQGVNGNANYTPHYHLTDHLGSVRVVAENKTTVLERSDYYPLGLRWETSDQQVSDNRYRFNGKEDQKFAGLDFLDYGARMYDPVIGRWFGQDKLAEKYYLMSPYAYCANNPMLYIDPDGLDWYLNELTGELYFNRSLSDEATIYNDQIYVRIGNNDMFGDMGNTDSKPYNYGESQVFARNKGYCIEPMQQLIQEHTYKSKYSTGKYDVTFTNGTQDIINEKYGIIPDNMHMMAVRTDYKKNIFDTNIFRVLMGMNGRNVIKRIYSSPKEKYDIMSTIGTFLTIGNAMSGEHDYVNTTVYQTWESYIKATNGNGELLKYRY